MANTVRIVLFISYAAAITAATKETLLQNEDDEALRSLNK